MSEGSDVRDHINQWNKFITQLLCLEVKIDAEDKILSDYFVALVEII